MSIVHCRDSRRDVTYVYESCNYWDKEAQKYKAKRKCIGKLDADGNIVPTRGCPGRPPKTGETQKKPPNDENGKIRELEARVIELTRRLSDAESELEKKNRMLQKLKKDLSALAEQLEI